MSCRALFKMCGSVAVLGFAGIAYAQYDAPAPITEPPPTEVVPRQPPPDAPPPPEMSPPPVAAPAVPPPSAPAATNERRHNRVFSPYEVSLTTGAGVGNYFGTAVSGDSIDPGAMWNARLTIGTRSVVALEASYMGGVNNVDIGGASHAQLFSNGIDGDLRFQLPLRVEPYVFGGVGYNHMEVRNQGTGVAAEFVGKDDQVTIPAGGGLTAYAGRHITVDARGTYRFIPDNGITLMTDRHLHQWMAQANVGYAF